jgi:DNA-binding NtrC family response regulator
VNETTRPRLLLADDEPLYLQTTSQLLQKAGYLCTCVTDAEAAIAALRTQSFDLVLTDLNMPGNLKLELLRAGRQDWPKVPLIVVTGVPSLPTAIESVRLGIADYLIKPVKFEVLLQSVQRLLAEQRGSAVKDGSVGSQPLASASPIMPREPHAPVTGSREEALGSTDKNYFQTLLRQYHGNISKAALHAGLSRQTLHKLLKKHQISAADFRRPG